MIESFQKYYGLDEVQAVQAVSYYREYYSTKGLFENKLIDGIPEILLTLKSAGKQLLVATSKPEFFSEQIISHYGIRPYFTYVAGATMDETQDGKERSDRLCDWSRSRVWHKEEYRHGRRSDIMMLTERSPMDWTALG